MLRIKNVGDIAKWRMCLGCGACDYICPRQNIQLVDVLDEGIRPFLLEPDACGSCNECLSVCPGYENDHRELRDRNNIIGAVSDSCGPVLEIWEGHASDPEIRFAGSSGGAITALSLYCLEQLGMHGVLHIGQDPDDVTRNRTRMSFGKKDLLRATGSRYAPASACDRLDLIESAPAPCVFIGQPSEVTALRKAQRLRPALDRNVGLTISFFCAGSPSRRGTLELLKRLGADLERVRDVRYRGNGWPGNFAVTQNGNTAPSRQTSYEESWGFLQAYRPYSTHLCPDGTGEDADISCGDPWYRPVQPGEKGSSLVVARTERGKEIIRGAIESGYLTLQQANPEKLLDSQRNLLAKRGAIWGRIATLRMFGLPTTKLKGFFLFRNWWRLSLKDKLRSILGTARRIIVRGYYRPLKLSLAVEQYRSTSGQHRSRAFRRAEMRRQCATLRQRN
jgi:coenzyme F420 hydrogenase subunit beta